MKRFIFALFVLVLLLISTISNARINVTSATSVFNKTIADSTEISIYVLFPDQWGEWYISETLPTSVKGSFYRGTNFSFPTQLNLVMEATTISGATDSLLHYITPLVWDDADGEFAEIVYDSTCVLLGVRQDYIAASKSYLDWTSGQEYHCPLLVWAPYISTTTDAIYWPTCGIVVHVRFVDASGGSLIYNLTINGVFEE